MRARIPSIALLLLAEGCVTVTLTAKNSVTPVLLGPVHHVHAVEGASDTKPVPFETTVFANWGSGSGEDNADWDVWRAAEGQSGKYIHVGGIRCDAWTDLTPGGRGPWAGCTASGEIRSAPQRAGDRGAEEAR